MSRTGPVHLDGWTRVRKRRGSEHPDRFPPAQEVRVISTDELRCSWFAQFLADFRHAVISGYSPLCLMRQWIHVLRQFLELFAELYAFLHEGGP